MRKTDLHSSWQHIKILYGQSRQLLCNHKITKYGQSIICLLFYGINESCHEKSILNIFNSFYKQRELRSDCTYVQSDQCLPCLHKNTEQSTQQPLMI